MSKIILGLKKPWLSCILIVIASFVLAMLLLIDGEAMFGWLLASGVGVMYASKGAVALFSGFRPMALLLAILGFGMLGLAIHVTPVEIHTGNGLQGFAGILVGIAGSYLSKVDE